MSRNTYQRPLLPWYYFQRVVGQQLEVRAPGGYATMISPLDVCDVLPGTPVVVNAVTPAAFKARQLLPRAERNAEFAPEHFAEASVLHAYKDKWGFITFGVWFTDLRHNGEEPWQAKLDVDEREYSRLVRRTVMPVISRSCASHSADHGTTKTVALDAKAVSMFIRSALRGDTGSASQLACAATRTITHAGLNRDFGMALF